MFHGQPDHGPQVVGTVLAVVDVAVSVLQHRVKSLLASVRPLFRDTIRHSDSAEGFALPFEGRLNALVLAERPCGWREGARASFLFPQPAGPR